MPGFLKRIFDEFVFGNYFISICVMAMVWTTYMMNGFAIELSPFTIFLSIATYLLYNFHRISTKIDYSGIDKIVHSAGKINIKPVKKIIYAASLVAMLVCIFFIDLRIVILLIPIALIALSYTAPMLLRNKKKVRLPEFPLVKTPVLALIWGLSTTFLPLIEQNITVFSPFIWLQFICRCLFMFALCIPFEMRDIAFDKSRNIHTGAVVFGATTARIFGSIILICEIILHHLMTDLASASIAMLDLTSLIAWVWILFQNEKRSPYFYKFWTDGTMVLRFLLLFAVIYKR